MDEYAERLVLDNMRLVYATCNRLTRAGVYSRMEREDMEQEGMIGLMQAAIAYDPARGVTFSTLAVTAIRNRILWVQQTANRQRRASNKNTLQLDKPIVEGKPVTLRDFLPDKTVDVEAKALAITEEDVLRAALRLGRVRGGHWLVRRIWGETDAEIGRRNGISKQAVNHEIQMTIRALRAAGERKGLTEGRPRASRESGSAGPKPATLGAGRQRRMQDEA